MLSTQMIESLQLKLLWNDNDMVELRVSGSNGRFSGTVDVYVPVDGLAEAAARLDGFPASPHDQRELAFGPAKGAVTMRFFCEGAAGRSFMEVSLESAHQAYQCAEGVNTESVCFHAPIEATAVDIFVSELRTMQRNLSGVAHLNLLVRR
jgi:hypothetical protein